MSRAPRDTPAEMPLQGVVRRADDALAREAVRRIARAGFPEIRPSHSSLFGSLPPEGARLTTIAQRAGVTKQSMAESVDDLVAAGYLTKETDPADGRAKIVRYTERGLKAARTGRRLYEEIERELEQELGRNTVRTTRRVLTAIAKNFGADESD